MLQENFLNLISSKLVNKKIESELDLENLLIKSDVDNFSEHSDKVIEAIDKYQETVSMLHFWENFKNEKIIIKNKNEKNE